MSFLKAEWRRLALVNYEVDPQVLKPFLPYKTELDDWNGIHYVSLVGFMFKDTKVLGVKIPFHIDFEEVNLRFYVKHKDGKEWKKGVVFIKEIVPKFAISFIANNLYKEHYQTLKMKHVWEQDGENMLTKYEWKNKGNWNSILIESGNEQLKINENSEEEFITEHYWGYTKINETTSYEYEVTHPKWNHYEIKRSKIEVDFEQTYGADFGFLNHIKPRSIMLAEGSEITVENKRKIT